MRHQLPTYFFLGVIGIVPLIRSLPEKTRPLVQSLLFTVFRNPGEKALLGPRGELFYKQDVRYLVEPLDLTEPRATIEDFRRQLAARGIRLIAVPVPVKPNRARPAPVGDIDLLPVVRNRYLAYDTHWTCEGAQLAARAVADRMREFEGSREYGVKPVTVDRKGDIIRMMDSPSLERHFPAEETPCLQVMDYKDDPESAVLVLGDSFLRIYQTDAPKNAGFVAHLARELKTPVASIVNDGGASTLVRQELARKPRLLKGKKVVVWEFVERDLKFGTEGWLKVALP
jgi:hypothetical protein